MRSIIIRAIDIIFIALVLVAIALSAMAFSIVISNFQTTRESSKVQEQPLPLSAKENNDGEDQDNFNGFKEGSSSFAFTLTDPDLNSNSQDTNADPSAADDDDVTTDENNRYGGAVKDYSRAADSSANGDLSQTPEQLISSVYQSSPFLLPITWGAVAGTLIWRGKVRSTWSKQGYDYDTFRLVAKMRGSSTRIRLLNTISTPKNKLQLAKELDVDWKTIDNHIEMLLQSRLVEEKTVVGTARYYVINENGTKILSLLSSNQQ